MKHITVNLNKKTVKVSGKTYRYWVLRWTSQTGKPQTEHVGQASGPKKISSRQARLLRSRKEAEINSNPGRSERVKACKLSVFLENYLQARKHELAPGSWELHKQTVKYLNAFFKEDPRLDLINKVDARAFKTALANGDLKYINKRKQTPAAATVDMNIRQARTIFNMAVDDDIIIINPFSKLSQSVKFETTWHYVSPDEYQMLVDAAPDLDWKVFISLCRLAGLRRGEALNLEWTDIDWEHNTIEIISKKTWKTKTRRSRKVPVCPELQALLLKGHSNAAEGQKRVLGIEPDKSKTNHCKRFGTIRKRAEIEPYSRPYHTLRKSCAQDWASRGVPPQALKEWMGHTKLETTMQFYLKVSKFEYQQISDSSFFTKSVQKSVQKPKNNNIDKVVN